MTAQTCTICGATFAGGSSAAIKMALDQHMLAAHGIAQPVAVAIPGPLRPPTPPPTPRAVPAPAGLPTGSVTLEQWKASFAEAAGIAMPAPVVLPQHPVTLEEWKAFFAGGKNVGTFLE